MQTVDHGEPAIGSKILFELFQKYNDVWLVELLMDDLLGWNDFIFNYRQVDYGVSWGAQLCNDTSCIGNARGESGMVRLFLPEHGVRVVCLVFHVCVSCVSHAHVG